MDKFLLSHFTLYSFRRLEREEEGVGLWWYTIKGMFFFPFFPLNKLTAAQPMCTSVNLLYQKESLSYLFYWIIYIFFYLDVASCCLFCLIHQTTISYDWESIVGYRRSRNAGCLLFRRQHLIVQKCCCYIFLNFEWVCWGFFFPVRWPNPLPKRWRIIS